MKSKLLIFVFLVPISLFSQERKILGRVLDSDTQKPIKDASVIILGTTTGTFSNQLGFFEITVDPSKHKTLVVSHIAFKTSEVLIPAEDRIKFSLKKEYILMGQLNLSLYPQKVGAAFNREQSEPKNDREIVGIEVGATYPNGIYNFYDFLGNSLTSQIPEGNQKSFDVTFTINEKGRAVEISISDSSAAIRNAVIQAFEKMADWTPATQRQNKAPQHFVLPIVRLKDDVTSLDLRNFYEFISVNIKYPAQARRMGVEGVVYVEFLTDNSGNVLSTKALKDIGADCGDEVRRIIAAVPKDLIRSLYSQTKSVNFILPVSFGLERPFKNQPFAPESDALLLGEIEVVAMGIERETRVLGNSSDVPHNSHPVGIPVINAFTSLPRAMKQPKAVRRLSLTNNGLSEFPSDILKLTNLEFLDLEKNQIQTLPNEIVGLTKLEELYVLGNQLQRLPSNIGNLKKLRILGLAYNQLGTFPLEITSLEKLEALDLSDNQLSSLPREIGALKNLKFLVLRNNRITSIPQEFYSLRKLEKIFLEGNPIGQKDIELLKATFSKTEIVFQPKSEIHSSVSPPVQPHEDDDIYKGGKSELSKLIANNLTYPPDDRSAGLEGKVLFKFKVKDGKLDSLEIINSVGPSIDMEARRVLQLTNGNWSIQSNESFLMPIIFIMDFPGRPENAELMTIRDKYLKQNNYEAALKYCEQLRRREPFNIDNLTKLIMVYTNLNQFDKVQEVEYLKSQVQRLKVVYNVEEELEKTRTADEVFLVVEDPASFPGGIPKFYDYVDENMKSPKEVKSGKVSGKVFVEFVIDSTGQIPPADVKVIKGLCKACDEEAVRLVKGSPNWNPGSQRGKPVKQRMVLPIMFR